MDWCDAFDPLPPSAPSLCQGKAWEVAVWAKNKDLTPAPPYLSRYSEAPPPGRGDPAAKHAFYIVIAMVYPYIYYYIKEYGMKKNIVTMTFILGALSIGPIPCEGSGTITDANWVEMGQTQGIQSYQIGDWWVNVLVTDTAGNLYAGGYPYDIPFAGGVKIDGIAKWDGRQWSRLACDSLRQVMSSAICSDGRGNLYAPVWDRAQNQYDFARWNGVAWTYLNTGFGVRSQSYNAVGIVKADAQGNLYVTGEFDSAGGRPIRGIAKWDGTAWSNLGKGIPGSSLFCYISAIAFDDAGNLYAGGSFDTAGEIVARNIAKWDGASWSALGKGVSGHVRTIISDENGVYAGGCFDTAGDAAARSVAKWDGRDWSPLGGGMNFPNNRGEVSVLAFDETGTLYASGWFDSAGGVAACNIAKWDGSAWHAAGNTVRHEVSMDHFYYSNFIPALACGKNNKLYAGGDFNIMGDAFADDIAQWDGARWSAIGRENSNGLNNYVLACAADKNGNVFAGGQFLTAGCKPLRHIGRWNGTGWTALGNGIEANWFGLGAMAVSESGILYAAGRIDSAGAAAANNIVQWDGAVWKPLGGGVNGDVNHLVAGRNGALYASGSFDSAGGKTAYSIAKWDGDSWSALGNDKFRKFYGYFPITLDKEGLLYAANYADTVDGAVSYRIVKWDGASWIPVGRSYKSCRVQALAVDGKGNLYAGGVILDTLDAVVINGIARWDGAAWSALGKGLRSTEAYNHAYVNALELDNAGHLYVGGNFDSAGQVPARNIARWDGSRWTALGSGTDGAVDALTFDSSGNLYVGGRFVTAGGKLSPHFAICRGVETATRPQETARAVRPVSLYRKNGLAYCELKAAATVEMRVYSLSGREIVHTSCLMNAGRHALVMPRGLARGAYIAQAHAGGESLRWRMLLDK
jgi:hypothetical protein